MSKVKSHIDSLIQAAVENLDMGLLREAYEVMEYSHKHNQISAQDAYVFDVMFESAAEMIEELV